MQDLAMCSHYQAEKRRVFYEKRFGIKLPLDWEPPRGGGLHIYPTQFAPILRRPPERDSGDEAVPDMEVIEARFGLLPSFAKEVKYGTRTYNARSETVATLASFKGAWAKARHCIVPCEAIYEPDWRTGTHVPTRFTTDDGEPWGIAGLWDTYRDEAGAAVDSYTMMTVNADDHDLLRNYHRPGAEKRMLVLLPRAQWGEWLDVEPDRSMQFMQQYPADRMVAAAAPPPPKKGETPALL